MWKLSPTHVGRGGQQSAPLENRAMRARLGIGVDSRHVTISTADILWPSIDVRQFIPDATGSYRLDEVISSSVVISPPTDFDQD